MDISYGEGTLLWYWFENWIVVGGFAAALVTGVAGAARSGRGIGGLLRKTLIVLAILAALPLTLHRTGLDITLSNILQLADNHILNAVTVGYLSLAGMAGALALGGPYLVPRKRGPDSGVGPKGRAPVQDRDLGLRPLLTYD